MLAGLYESGMSLNQIAAHVGTNMSAVRKALLDQGVTLRSRKQGIQLARAEGRAGGRKGQKDSRTPEQVRACTEAAVKARQAKALGVSRKPSGYIAYTTGPNKDRSVHVVVMEQAIGRRLRRAEVVHHKNGIRDDNSLDNLQLMTRAEHARHHALEESGRARDSFGRFCEKEEQYGVA